MPAKKPEVRPLGMTLRSRSRSQDIQTSEESKLEVAEQESKLEVAEEKSKRKVRKNLRQETVKEELNNNVAKEQPEEKVFEEELKPPAARRVERRKREGKAIDRDAKVAKIGEKKKSARSGKSKKCEVPEEPRTEMQKTMLGSEERDQIETVMENKAKRKTAIGRRQLRSDATSVVSQSDETIQETFSTEDWRVIEGIKGRAERIFDVTLVASVDERSKAANITISGSNGETRLLCKEYLFALTRPGCTTVFPYPPERHSFLTEDAVHERLERDSQAYLVFRRIGEVEIYGLDSLSVALAMSSLESLLENHRVSDSVRPEKEHQKSSRRSSLLLDAELKNWMGGGSEDCVYRKTNDAVRHSILSVVKDESMEIRMKAKKVEGATPPPLRVVHSPALHSSALKLLSDAYMSVLEDSVAPLSPFAAEDNSTASLGMESVKKNISKDPDFAGCSVQHKENVVVEAEAVKKKIDKSAVETETKQREITNAFTADKTRQGKEKLDSGTKAKQTESTNEYIAMKDSKQKMKSIIVSSGSGSRTQKDRRDRSRTTPVDSNSAGRNVYHHNGSGVSCEIKVPSGDRRPRQIHGSKPGINLPDSGSKAQKDQHGHSKTTTPAESNSTERKVYLRNDSGLSCKIRVPSGSSGSSNTETRSVQSYAKSSTKRHAVRSDSLKEVKPTQNPSAAGSNPVAPPVIYPLLSIVAQPPTSSLASGTSNSKLRYVVIDGSNVAMAHGKNQAFSCPGIEICIKYFLERGHREDQITAFVPQSRLCRPHASHKPIVGQHLLQKLANTGLVVFTPARKVPGRNIVCYDDRYVLRLAAHTNGIIVTNDNYRDLWLERKEWREIIENCLLPFSFVNDLFMPPDDPLGRNGPNLNQFLANHHQPHLGQRNHTANPQTGGISMNAKQVSVNQWYKNR